MASEVNEELYCSQSARGNEYYLQLHKLERPLKIQDLNSFFFYTMYKKWVYFLDFTEHLNSWKSQCYVFKWNLVTFLIFLEGHRKWMTLLFGICLAIYFALVLDASGIL